MNANINEYSFTTIFLIFLGFVIIYSIFFAIKVGILLFCWSKMLSRLDEKTKNKVINTAVWIILITVSVNLVLSL